MKSSAVYSELFDIYMSAVNGELHSASDRLDLVCELVNRENSTAAINNYQKYSRLIDYYSALNKDTIDLSSLAPELEGGLGDQFRGIEPEGLPGVSLVTCAMNRTENLLKALPSWLDHDVIDEIVIVDWSSRVPLSQVLPEAGFDDPRIKIVRVDNEPRWILAYAFNIGFRASTRNRIIKTDADILISENFFLHNTLPNSDTFIAGNWRTADVGQTHVNGFFYTSRAALSKVNGFNEFIMSYGWDDDDLYARLEGIGMKRQDVDNTSIYHIPHSDSERTGETTDDAQSARDAIMGSPAFQIQRNRILCDMLPVWDGSKELLSLHVKEEKANLTTLVRAKKHTAIVSNVFYEEASRKALLEHIAALFGMEAYRLNREAFEAMVQRPLSSLSRKAILEGLDKNAPLRTLGGAPAISSGRTKFYIDAQHGLGNRLRAIGSAAAVAEATDRELVIIWQPDHHCDCRLHDLFDYKGAVEEESFSDVAESMGYDLYNYMTAENGAQKNSIIIPQENRSIYVRSAFVLNSTHSYWESENRFIRSLSPVEKVRDLVASVRSDNDLAVHVRMAGGEKFEHLPYESANNWSAEDHLAIAKWREKSHFTNFFSRIDVLLQSGSVEQIFLAADLPQTYEEFLARYGERITFLSRDAYDRSSEQLCYALADAIHLSRPPRLLGSNWSSFSELAVRLATVDIKVEMSGVDF